MANGLVADIDEGIADLVEACWWAGISTLGSCEEAGVDRRGRTVASLTVPVVALEDFTKGVLATEVGDPALEMSMPHIEDSEFYGQMVVDCVDPLLARMLDLDAEKAELAWEPPVLSAYNDGWVPGRRLPLAATLSIPVAELGLLTDRVTEKVLKYGVNPMNRSHPLLR